MLFPYLTIFLQVLKSLRTKISKKGQCFEIIMTSFSNVRDTESCICPFRFKLSVWITISQQISEHAIISTLPSSSMNSLVQLESDWELLPHFGKHAVMQWLLLLLTVSCYCYLLYMLTTIIIILCSVMQIMFIYWCRIITFFDIIFNFLETTSNPDMNSQQCQFADVPLEEVQKTNNAARVSLAWVQSVKMWTSFIVFCLLLPHGLQT